MKTIESLVVKKRNLNTKTKEFDHTAKSNIYTLDGERLDIAIDERYLIYDCTNKGESFNLEKYSELLENNEDVNTIPLFIFDNWESEMSQYLEIYNTSDGKTKRKIKELFAKKISIYQSICEEVLLEVEEPINYLEYLTESDLNGHIYNINFKQLKKLFNITGEDLFKKNIRKGINDRYTTNILNNKFRSYISVSYFDKIRKSYKDDEEELLDLLNINNNTLSEYKAERFWFCHNGITLFSYDSKEINRSGNSIKLNPWSVSVINGAQTMTNFFNGLELFRNEIKKVISDTKFSDEAPRIDEDLDEVCREINVKTIFINGKEEDVHTITNGLNTQIPITNEDRITDEKIVEDLNNILIKKGIEIVKPGYISHYGASLNVNEFAKKYLLVEKTPGLSKNLRKNLIPDILERALEKLELESDNIITSLKLIINIDAWWQETKKSRAAIYEDSKAIEINSYGKNYFQSYLINEKNKDFDFDETNFLFDAFVKRFSSLRENLNLGDFKTDDLFNEYLASNENKAKYNIDYNDLDNNDLLLYVNENIKSQYAISKVISDYLIEKGYEIKKFRVITRNDGKAAEAFPFPSSTFNEVVERFTFSENKDEINEMKFKDSSWFKVLKQPFCIFIIDKAIEDESKFASNIEIIDEFSFEGYECDAEIVYDKTITAFEKGDIALFPKTSDKIKFHVRTKGIDSNDTFEFTDGNQITKRTFWANKSTVDEIIAKLVKC